MGQVLDPKENNVIPNDKIERSFIGIDAGGSSTCAVLVSHTGILKKVTYGDVTNPLVQGFEASLAIFISLLKPLLLVKNLGPPTVIIALSGGESPQLRDRYICCLQNAIDFPDGSKIFVCHDLLAPLGLIIPNGKKIQQLIKQSAPPTFAVLIAGTGSVAGCFSIMKGPANEVHDNEISFRGPEFSVRHVGKVGGWGPLLGDGGSAYRIAMTTLSLSLRAYDGMNITEETQSKVLNRFSKTRILDFSKKILEHALSHFSVPCGPIERMFDDLVVFIHNTNCTRGHIAALTRKLTNLLEKGNGVCEHVFTEAADELGRMLVVAVEKSQSEGRSIPTAVCAMGGVFGAWRVPCFQTSFQQAITPLRNMGVNVVIQDTNLSHASNSADKNPCVGFACARLAAVAYGYEGDAWEQNTQVKSVKGAIHVKCQRVRLNNTQVK